MTSKGITLQDKIDSLKKKKNNEDENTRLEKIEGDLRYLKSQNQNIQEGFLEVVSGLVETNKKLINALTESKTSYSDDEIWKLEKFDDFDFYSEDNKE